MQKHKTCGICGKRITSRRPNDGTSEFGMDMHFRCMNGMDEYNRRREEYLRELNERFP